MSIAVESGVCMHCGACVGSCPMNAMYLDEVKITINEDCNKCKLCVKVCPVGAIELIE